MATINIFNGLNKEYKTIHANGKLSDVFQNYNIHNYLALKEGNRLDADYELTEQDVVFLRNVPKGLTTTAIATIAVVASVVALGVGVGAAIYAKKKSNALQEKLESSQNSISSTTKLPFVRGSNNTSAISKTIPFVMGRTYFSPYKLNDGFYSVSGNNGENQFWNIPLVMGYNNQRIESVSIGNSKIKEFDTTSETSQDGHYTINHDLYGDIEMDISTNGELQMDGLNQKVIGAVYNEEVKHAWGKDAEPVIEQLESNAMRVQVCIQMDGLRKYNSDSGSYEALSIKVVPYWSNDNGETWNKFYFDIYNDGSQSYQTVEITSEEDKEQAVADGYISAETITVQTGQNTYKDVTIYHSNNADYSVEYTKTNYSESTSIADWKFYHKELISGENVITRNTNETCRFVATKEFTPAESYSKDIQIKVVKETVTAENNTNETVILQYINTWCYDNTSSSENELVTCYPLRNPFRDQTLRIGMKFEANTSTDNILDEINTITCGCARTWDGSSWTEYKEPTRNPAAWILEILTSDFHNKSKYDDSEIDLSSLGSLYEYCETNELYCDGVVTDGTKKSDLLSSILSSCFADLILDEDGKLSVVIDKAETTPVALINEQNIVSIEYAKTFSRAITGLKTTYTNSDDWSVATEYFFKDGHTVYDQITDTVSELALDYVTTHNHAYKVAQRQMRQTVLQPRTITVNVGLEGDCYPLYSTVLLQTARFKQGIQSVTIHKVIKNTDGNIVGFELSDKIEFVSGNKYGIIVQAQSDNGKQMLYSEIAGTGFSNTVTLANALSSSIDVDYGNIASIGLLNQDGTFSKVTNTMKIMQINPASNHGWELVLKDYNEAIYETGTIPAYKSNITKRPTTRKELSVVKPVDVDEARHENWSETKDLVEGLQEQINQIVTDTTVCSADILSAVFDISDAGYTMTEQSITTHLSLKQSEIDLDFQLGTIELPDGFSYSWNSDTKALTITVGEDVRIKAGLIKIPVQYKPIVSYNEFVDENGETFVDEDGTSFADVIYSDTYTEWNLYMNYTGSGLGVYLGTISTLANIPSTTNVGDYFTWSGDNKKESTLAYDGYFLQAQVYKYIGDAKSWKWEVDENSAHAQAALSDVLGIANADLKNNNSKVWEYLDHLTANSVYADMLVANEGFIDKLSSKIITADLVTTDQLESASIDLSSYNFADKSEIPDVPNVSKVVKSVRTLFYKTTSTTAPSAPTSSSQIVDTNTTGTWTSYQVSIADSYYIYACTEETYYDNTVGWTDVYTHTKTIISGGYIRTGLIHADEVTASCVKTTELKSASVDLSKYDYATTTAAKGYASAAETNAKNAIPNVKNLVKAATTLYFKTALGNAAPSKPTSTSEIVDTNTNDTWTSYVVEFDSAYNIFCCTQETTYDNTVSWTDVYTAVSTIIKDGYIRTGALSADVLTSENISTKSLNVKGMITQGLKSFAMMELCFGYDSTNHMMVFSSTFFRITGATSGKNSEGEYYISDTYGNVITRIDKGIFKFQLKDSYTKSKYPAIWENDDWDVIQLIPLIRFSSNYTIANDGITYANSQNALNAKIKKGCSRSVYGGTFTELEEALLEPIYQGTPPYISFTGLQKSSWYHDTTNGYYEFYLITTDIDAGTLADPSGTIDIDIHAYFF